VGSVASTAWAEIGTAINPAQMQAAAALIVFGCILSSVRCVVPVGTPLIAHAEQMT
jgi:hypothetical protein